MIATGTADARARAMADADVASREDGAKNFSARDDDDDDDGDDDDGEHRRRASAASALERENYTQLRMDQVTTLLRFEEPGPLDGDLEFEKLGALRGAVLNFIAAFRVFRTFLITAESVVVSVISIASTLFFALYEVGGHRMAVNLSWTFVSFAIIYPLTGSLDSAFRRREEALKQLATFKTSIISFYQAHRDWDWGQNGRKDLPENHVYEVRWLTVGLVCDVRNFLTAPEVTRLVHLNTRRGRVAWTKGRKLQWAIARRVREHFQKLSVTTEALKFSGMPGNESSRIRQFTKEAHNAWEQMRFLKTYRTPMATRAFARVYILIHPIFWGPYYAQLVSDILHDEAGGYSGAEIYDVPTYTSRPRRVLRVLHVSHHILGDAPDFSTFDTASKILSRRRNVTTKPRRRTLADYTRGQDQVLINKELRELVNDLCLEFDNTFEPSGGGVPACMFPSPQTIAIAKHHLCRRAAPQRHRAQLQR